MKTKKLTWIFLICILCCGCAFTTKMVQNYINMHNEETRNIVLDNVDYKVEATTEVPRSYKADKVEPIAIPYSEIEATNSDIVGWRSFPSAGLSVPLLKGSDNEFYLKHSYNKMFTWSGSIFMDYRLPTDFSAPNTLIYGHHMPDGSGFTNLFSYENKEHYDQSDNHIYITTKDKTYEFIIFSVVEKEAGTIFTQRKFERVSYSEFFTTVASSSMYPTGVPVCDQDRVISLVTCLKDSTSNMRLIIYAKLLS